MDHGLKLVNLICFFFFKRGILRQNLVLSNVVVYLVINTSQ